MTENQAKLIETLAPRPDMTRQEQADAMGISLSTLQSLLSGRRTTHPRHIKLAEGIWRTRP